jgi:hypothetical protein
MSVIMVKLELLIEDDVEEEELEDACLEDYVKDLIEDFGLDDYLVDSEYKILECDFVKSKIK